ncbi:MAG: tRNA1(Val) (adenine(37)-N6)-methyltransferase [Lachnospiraceae bacterium]|nr:tRNA1(Val) (adenine(37)-N6)-methyltransferase [Lachnospiraceae bacterium]
MDTSGNGLVKEGERVDSLQRNGYEILQHPGRFCFGMDAVLLSAFASVKPGENLLDLCTGTGVLPILLEAKTKGSHFTGLEIQEESADMANRSVMLNHLEDKIDIVCGDLREAEAYFAAASFDVITCNPPYMIAGDGLVNPEDTLALSRHEVGCTLDDVLAATKKCLKAGGRFYMVHRPFRLAEILKKMSDIGLEPKAMRMVYPYVDREPNMVLIEGRRGVKSGMKIAPPLIIMQSDGTYTDEVANLYNS